MNKIYSTRVFQVEGDLSVLCQCEDTRSGFRHVARVMSNGRETSAKPVKICYYNRTWESFEFESVLHELADKAKGLSDSERTAIRAIRG